MVPLLMLLTQANDPKFNRCEIVDPRRADDTASRNPCGRRNDHKIIHLKIVHGHCFPPTVGRNEANFELCPHYYVNIRINRSGSTPE